MTVGHYRLAGLGYRAFRSLRLAVLCAALASAASAQTEPLSAETLPQQGPSLTPGLLEQGETRRVTGIVDGDTLVLDSGREVRLVGIQAPKLPLGRKNFPTWPLAGEAKTALSELTFGSPVVLSYGGRRQDRHRRILAHLTTQDGLWVQGELLRLGLARVYSFPDNRALVAEMLALEREARAARRGIWGHPFYALRRHEEAEDHLGKFELVEGRVREVAVVRGRAYLNFGDDWRSDFTLVLEPAVRRLFEAEGYDPGFYRGRRLRVRGWINFRNGAMISVTHPEQIEVLDR